MNFRGGLIQIGDKNNNDSQYSNGRTRWLCRLHIALPSIACN